MVARNLRKVVVAGTVDEHATQKYPCQRPFHSRSQTVEVIEVMTKSACGKCVVAYAVAVRHSHKWEIGSFRSIDLGPRAKTGPDNINVVG